MSTIIIDLTHEQCAGRDPGCLEGGRLLAEFGLYGFEQFAINDRRLFTRQDIALEGHLADIKAIAQEMSERTTGKWNAAHDTDRL